MSMIFQSYAIWPNMTVEQNVAFGLKLRKLPREEVRQRVGRDARRRAPGRIWRNAIRPSCPAASSSAWRSRARSWSSRRCCCSTSRCRTSTPTCARRCASRSAGCTTSSASPRSTSRTTRPRRWSTSDRIAVMNQGRIEQVDDPHTLYNRPKTRFVAGFIGRTNFIEGHQQRRPDRVRLVRAAACRARGRARAPARSPSRCGRRACGCRARNPPTGSRRSR